MVTTRINTAGEVWTPHLATKLFYLPRPQSLTDVDTGPNPGH